MECIGLLERLSDVHSPLGKLEYMTEVHEKSKWVEAGMVLIASPDNPRLPSCAGC